MLCADLQRQRNSLFSYTGVCEQSLAWNKANNMAATCTSSFLGTSLSARPRTAAPAGEPFACLITLWRPLALLSAEYELHKGLSTALGGNSFTSNTTAETKSVGCAMVSAERSKSIRHFSLSLAIWVPDLRYAGQQGSVSLAHLLRSLTGC